jgi:hypothetical protein
LIVIDDRNLTSPTYIEEVAEKIYQKLPLYAQVMQKLLNQIEQQLDGERQE